MNLEVQGIDLLVVNDAVSKMHYYVENDCVMLITKSDTNKMAHLSDNSSAKFAGKDFSVEVISDEDVVASFYDRMLSLDHVWYKEFSSDMVLLKLV